MNKLITGMLALSAGTLSAATAELAPQAFQRLPLGAVRPETWLRNQLELQAKGLTGKADEIFDDIGKSDWLTGKSVGGQFAWERGPYYAKGMIALAYVIDDAELKAKASNWVESMLKSQRPNGDFGPRANNWWANMIVLHFMRDVFEVTGDERIERFLAHYFEFQLHALPDHPLLKDSNWAASRGGDNLEIVLWLYERNHDPKLMELAKILCEQTADWAGWYASIDRYATNYQNDRCYQKHIVNFNQGMKTPALKWRVTRDPLERAGYDNATRGDSWAMQKCGRVDGMVNGTEPLTNRSSTEGTELCAVAERILSAFTAMSILGDVSIADQMEIIAYNTLPGQLTTDGKGLRYYTLLNQPQCVNKNLGFVCNRDNNAICPSPEPGYGCCRSNYHFAWPKFVQSMWMATPDKGLAAIAYGPNSVTYPVGKKGQTVKILEQTNYPFYDTVTFKVLEGEAKFPLLMRIPEWCEGATVALNGGSAKAAAPGTFYKLERGWKVGDTVTLKLPMRIECSHWIFNSVAVQRGPLIYSLKIANPKYTVTKDWGNGYATREITPGGPWNYALCMRTPDTIDAEVQTSATVYDQPFDPDHAPICLQVKAVRTSECDWGNFRTDLPGRAVDPPPSPIKGQGVGPVETVTLVPMGSTQIRVTLFPWLTM